MFAATGITKRFTPTQEECRLRGLLPPPPTLQRSVYVEIDGEKVRLCDGAGKSEGEKPKRKRA